MLFYYSLELNLKIALSRNPIMFFHRTSERQNERECEKERTSKEKGIRKSYFENDSQEANENSYI